MTSTVHIAVDCMSGDFGPQSNLNGIISVIDHHPDIHFHLCGSEEEIVRALPQTKLSNISIYPTNHVIAPDLKPSAALRMKELTCLHMALDLVANRTASIIVSSANTGAYMALSLKKIGLRPNIKRPAIGKVIPSMYEDSICKETLMLDLGANVNCSVETLISFGMIAKDYLASTKHLNKPKIGILNIGSEAGKGTEELQSAFNALSLMEDIDFIGFVEGHHLLAGVADAIVSDGFHGNIALKTMEGTIKGFYNILKMLLRRPSLKAKLGALLIGSHLKRTFGEVYNPKKFNGALFMGLNGNVLKSHGNADAESFAYALKAAYQIVISSER
jgi:glycerol-3-phosphate acyltransferase PlsX